MSTTVEQEAEGISAGSVKGEVDYIARFEKANIFYDLAPGSHEVKVATVGSKLADSYGIPAKVAECYCGVLTSKEGKAPKINAPGLGKLLRAETPVAVGGRALYVYSWGAYRPGGDDYLQRRIRELLGSVWSDRIASEVMSWLAGELPLDEHPRRDRVNCTNGVYNVTSGQLEDHNPEYRTPVQIGAAFDADASCPAIDQFLTDVLPDPADRQLFLELAGYLLIPNNDLQKAFMFVGAGANGKTTALKVLEALLGVENVSHVALHQLEDDRFALAELYGVLANIYADLDSRSLSSTSTFKGIVGGDTQRGERKFKEPFTFTPYARLLFSANSTPPTPDGSPGFNRRWVVVPFNQQFSEMDADEGLPAKLTTPAELSGFLNKALEALPGLLERGHFAQTKSTEAAGEAFKLDTDSVAGFLADCVKFNSESQTKRSGIYAEYKKWCELAGRGTLSRQKFNQRLRDDHPDLSEAKLDGYDFWQGLEIKALAADV